MEVSDFVYIALLVGVRTAVLVGVCFGFYKTLIFRHLRTLLFTPRNRRALIPSALYIKPGEFQGTYLFVFGNNSSDQDTTQEQDPPDYGRDVFGFV